MKLNDFTTALEQKYGQVESTITSLNESFLNEAETQGDFNKDIEQVYDFLQNVRMTTNGGDYLADLLWETCKDFEQNGAEMSSAMDKAQTDGYYDESCKIENDDIEEGCKRLKEDFIYNGVSQVSFDVAYNDYKEVENFINNVMSSSTAEVLGVDSQDITYAYQDIPEYNESLTEATINEEDSTKKVTQVKMDLLWDPTLDSDDYPMSDPESWVQGLEWEMENIDGYVKLLGYDFEDITDTYKHQYPNLLEGKQDLPIRKALQNSDIMSLIDRDPKGAIQKAIDIVNKSEEVSDKDKYMFSKNMKGNLSKAISTLATYFYDVNKARLK